MKKIFEKLIPGLRLPALTKEKLMTARFRKLLENARAIMNLVEDGREKLREEYIFDRHYVTSLVDQVIERAGMLVFDAVVIAPEGGEGLFRLHDRLKTVARERFIKDEGAFFDNSEGVSSPPLPEEPELRMLSIVLTWIAGPTPDGQPVMMDLIRCVFDHVIPAIQNSHDPAAVKNMLEWPCGDVNNRMAVIELEAEPGREGPLSLQDIECRPLGLLLTGIEGKEREKYEQKQGIIRKWIACTGREQLSLHGSGEGNGILVEATLSGHVDSDFIFLFAEFPTKLTSILPDGFRVEKTGLGELAWSYDVPGRNMENSLARLGARLLCPRSDTGTSY
ncbi:MAG: hypothetical protein Q7U02_08180 [Desulfosalsimonadaceae bacterium]|nr:hypothetical protein [Desulfosalsimonadaceae bacterium]